MPSVSDEKLVENMNEVAFAMVELDWISDPEEL